MSMLAIFLKYPTYYKIFFHSRLVIIAGSLATRVKGTGILPGIALTCVLLLAGAVFLNLIENSIQPYILHIKNPL